MIHVSSTVIHSHHACCYYDSITIHGYCLRVLRFRPGRLPWLMLTDMDLVRIDIKEELKGAATVVSYNGKRAMVFEQYGELPFHSYCASLVAPLLQMQPLDVDHGDRLRIIKVVQEGKVEGKGEGKGDGKVEFEAEGEAEGEADGEPITSIDKLRASPGANYVVTRYNEVEEKAAADAAAAAAAERNRVAQVERERVAKEKEDRLQVYLQSLSPRDRLKHDSKIQCMMIFGENVDMEVLDRLLGEGVKRSNATEGVSKRVTYVCVCVCVLCVFMCVYVCVCTLYQGSLCNVAPALLSIH